MKLSQEEVFQIIREERKYQDTLGNDLLPLEGEIILLDKYIDKAKSAYCDTMNDPTEMPTREVLRKIAAIAVRCLENYGCPPRIM